MATRKNAKKAARDPNKPKGAPRNKKNILELASGKIAIYASPRISHAMEEVVGDMTLYNGVRMLQVIEAAYTQGKKDGARAVFDDMDKRIKDSQKLIPHKNPGKPKKKS
jgi:hypothetical protein